MSTDRRAELFGLLSLNLEPVTPPPDVRARLLSAITGADRYAPFAGALARSFDLTMERARELLTRLQDPSGWAPGVDPILAYLHFQPGPALGAGHAGFARLKRGLRIPAHRHHERELTLVLEGRLMHDDGTEFGPGQILEMLPGSTHVVHVQKNSDAVVATLQARIEMLGI